MKFSTIISSILAIFIISACNKEIDQALPTPIKTAVFTPFSIGSVFTFNSSIGSYTNSVLGDTVISGKVYKRVQNTKDDYRTYYLYQSGEYKVSGISPMYAGGLTMSLNNFIYLKDNVPVNTAWSVSVPVKTNSLNYTARFDFKIIAVDTIHTINSKLYKNVIKVEQKITNVFGTQEQPAGKNMFWFSKDIGLIETDALSTKLVTFNIK